MWEIERSMRRCAFHSIIIQELGQQKYVKKKICERETQNSQVTTACNGQTPSFAKNGRHIQKRIQIGGEGCGGSLEGNCIRQNSLPKPLNQKNQQLEGCHVKLSTMNKSYKYVGNRKKHERSFFMYRNQLGAMTIKNLEKKRSKSQPQK